MRERYSFGRPRECRGHIRCDMCGEDMFGRKAYRARDARMRKDLDICAGCHMECLEAMWEAELYRREAALWTS